MNFKPFCINIENMTDSQLKEVFNKTLDAGGSIGETERENYRYFGVDAYNETMFWNDSCSYGTITIPAILITLEELDEHLGIIKENTKQLFDLRNTKIDVRKRDENGVPTNKIDVELSKAFQEVVCGDDNTKYSSHLVNNLEESRKVFTQSPFLFVNDKGILSLVGLEKEDYFYQHTSKEITFIYERKITWETKEVEKNKETITLPNGDVYDAEELQKVLSDIKKLN